MKTLIILLLSFFILLLTAIIFLPSLISTDFGKKRIVQWVNQKIPGRIEIEQLQLSWFRTQKAHGFRLYDKQNNKILDFESGNVERTLPQLFFGELDNAQIEIQNLNLHLIEKGKNYTNLQEALGLRISPFQLYPKPLSIQLQNANATIQKNNNLSNFWAKGITKKDSLNGNFEIKGTYDHIEHYFENLSADISNFPVALLDQYFEIRYPQYAEYPTAILGDIATISWRERKQNGTKHGTLQLTTPNLKATTEVSIDHEKITLLKQLNAHIILSPEMIRTVFPYKIPLLSDFISAENPVRLTIDPGSTFPIHDRKKLAIKNAVLDLGKMTFRNSDTTAELLSILQTNPQDTISIWFTPLYFYVEAGKIYCKRTDMLLMNKYPIALWGKIDLIKEKVDMKLGISGKALKEALGIKKLDANYMLPLALKGPFHHLSIDKTKALAKIGALIMQNQGKESAILGTVLDIVTGGLQEEPVPPPTTSPFPWKTK